MWYWPDSKTTVTCSLEVPLSVTRIQKIPDN